MSKKPVRPRQITLSGWLVLVGSVVVVGMAFQQIATLGSLESQEAAADLVSRPPGDGLGLSAGDVQAIQRVLALIAGATGAASAILGLMVLHRRVPSDRLVLTVLSPVLFVAGISVAGLSAAVVVAAIAFLWTPPARAWYAGLDPAPPVRTSGQSATAAAPAGPPAQHAQSPSTQDAQDTYAGTVATAPPQPSPQTSAQPAVPGSRPGQLVAACVITWVCCGIAILLALATSLVFAISSESVFEQLREQNPDLAEQGLTDHVLKVTVFVGTAVLVPWCLAAIVFAGLAFRRVRWAALALLVAVGLAGLACAVLLVGSIVMVLPLAACLTTSWLVSRPACRTWFGVGGSARDSMRS